MNCLDDSCDLAHCNNCGCHYEGSTSGLCQDCQFIKDDAEYEDMVKEWLYKSEDPINK